MRGVLGLVPLAFDDSSVAVGALCVLIGGGLLALYHQQRRRGAATERWPTTDGTVTHAKRRHDSPYVEYEYEVDGTTYENNTVWLGSNATTVEGATEMVEENQPGSTVTVHYDPDDPGSAVLSPGTPSNRGTLVFASVLVIVGVGVLLFV